MPKRIPISAAKRVAEEQGCKQVILVAWDGERTHVVTYGSTKEECRQAALGGDFVKKALGYPDDAMSTYDSKGVVATPAPSADLIEVEAKPRKLVTHFSIGDEKE